MESCPGFMERREKDRPCAPWFDFFEEAGRTIGLQDAVAAIHGHAQRTGNTL